MKPARTEWDGLLACSGRDGGGDPRGRERLPHCFHPILTVTDEAESSKERCCWCDSFRPAQHGPYLYRGPECDDNGVVL